jgi:ankyrin repeat protein
MNRSTRFQKGLVVVLLLSFAGVVGYMRVLHQAMERDRQKVQYLEEHVLQAPVMVASREKSDRERRLLRAVREDDVEEVKRFFQEGVTTKTLFVGQPLSMHAISSRADRVWAFLLSRGTDVNARDVEGRTPLMEAAKQMHPAVVASLLARGAKADAVDGLGRTVLMHAGLSPATEHVGPTMKAGEPASREFRRYDRKTVRLVVLPLLKHGAQVKRRDRRGVTALRYVAKPHLLPLVRLLLDHGADPNEAIGSAVIWGDREMARLLLDRGADPNKPVLTAIGNIDSEMLELLIARGADVNRKDPLRKETPLHYANSLCRQSGICNKQQEEQKQKILQALIKAGAKTASR